jgi:hypothetical protein
MNTRPRKNPSYKMVNLLSIQCTARRKKTSQIFGIIIYLPPIRNIHFQIQGRVYHPKEQWQLLRPKISRDHMKQYLSVYVHVLVIHQCHRQRSPDAHSILKTEFINYQVHHRHIPSLCKSVGIQVQIV